eukprot:CAMPEP_0182475670 /NCGR_PEP_ID=MMETSP1319-20130603/27750_1 /TAXON_ID=172717 /ORGANISM="Bolidomonas pacifica, Strain RCC208" /LENGTH=183 /DNA_ID=CAMNT_0024676685 /DNA_START=38 /DNA_END=586 /DNA_ORIENTATION=-
MQESEVNMKKVTVMMGRKTELRDDEEDQKKPPRKESLGSHVNIVELGNQGRDILDLSLILPVEGQHKQVQFSFDLVKDHPTAVAREMVTELNVSEGDVAAISSTIHSLAVAARARQARGDATGAVVSDRRDGETKQEQGGNNETKQEGGQDGRGGVQQPGTGVPPKAQMQAQQSQGSMSTVDG